MQGSYAQAARSCLGTRTSRKDKQKGSSLYTLTAAGWDQERPIHQRVLAVLRSQALESAVGCCTPSPWGQLVPLPHV